MNLISKYESMCGFLMFPHLLQFERIGFFVVDLESDVANNKFIFNLTVALKDSKPKDPTAPSKSRKEEQAKQLAEKQARMSIPAEDMFRGQTDLYSQFDEFGIPTHDNTGEKISKSAYKKLKKDWDKQKALYESNKKQNVMKYDDICCVICEC